MNWFGQATFPSSVRRGGRDIKKNGAKPPYLERTGWSLTSHVAGMHSENLRCERPPRLRRFGGFATFFYCAATPPHRGGDYSPGSHFVDFHTPTVVNGQ